MSAAGWQVAEIGRLLHAHRLDPLLTCMALGIDAEQAARLASAGEIDGAAHGERAALLLNILIRLELRCGHDSRAIAAAIERPAAELDGASIGETLRLPVDEPALRRLRAVAGSLPLPKIKMWRVADTYS